MRVNEFFVQHPRRAAAAGTLAAILALAGCDALKPPQACSVTIAPLEVTLSVNSTQPVVGTAFDCKGNTLRTKRTSFSSNNTLVANVTPDGIVIGVGVGQTTISATADGKSASAQVTVTPEAAASVSVTPSPYVLRQGQSKKLTAVAKNSRNEIISGRTFQWSSSNSSIASVDAEGTVTAHNVGTVNIGARTDDDVQGTAQVQVTLMPIGSCSLSPENRKLTVTETFQPTLSLRDTANNPLPTTGRTMSWSSSNEVTATVSNSGVVTARKKGTATITAAWDQNTTINCEMDVEAVDPRIITATIQQRNQTLRLTIPKQFTVVLLDSTNKNIPLEGRQVTWSTLTPAVATVSATGMVTGISLGQGRIMVDAEGVQDTVTVTVTKIPVGTVEVTPSQSSVIQGQTKQLNIVIKDSVGTEVTDRDVAWTSSDPVRAMVDDNGLVTTFGTGTVTITATSENKSDQAQVLIQQIPGDSVRVLPDTVLSFPSNQANKSFTFQVLDANGNVLLGRNITISSSNPAIVQASANAQTGIVTITANTQGSATLELRPLNQLDQPEGKTTRMTITITAPTPP